MAVAEVMKTDAWKAGASHQAVEGLAEEVRVGRRALGTSEHEPVILVLGSER
jgi:hypothetical protein